MCIPDIGQNNCRMQDIKDLIKMGKSSFDVQCNGLEAWNALDQDDN